MSQALVEEVSRLLNFAPLSFFSARPDDRAFLIACADAAESELDLPNHILRLIADTRLEAEEPADETAEIGEDG